MQKIDEAKVERIAKNIVGMGYQTSIVKYDEINDVRPSVTAFINGIRDYVANLPFNASKITLQKQFSYNIPRFNITYTPQVINRISGALNTTSKTTKLSITLLATLIYEVDGSLILKDYDLSANKTYNGTLYAEMKPNIRLGNRVLPATTPEPICNVELASGKANNVILDDSSNLIESWLEEIEVILNNKFTNNAHVRTTP